MSPDELTAAWFSDLLGGSVTRVSHRPIGDGLVGMNLRCELVHDRPGGLPTSVVVKLPSADPTSRATGVALRNYEREVKFYDELASTVDIRVPHCWHADWDAATGDFVLVLEDMAPAEQGDQVAGCDPDAAHDAVRELARLHGPRWGDPTLDDVDWLSRRTEADAEQLVGLWAMFLPGFLDTYRAHLTDEQFALLESFGPRLGEWVSPRPMPATVTHGDYRLDNLLFGSGDAPPVTAVDWQTPGHGPGSTDLSYFIGAGLVPDARRLNEWDLLDAYVDELTSYGVTVDGDLLRREYRRASFAGVIMAVVASQVVGGSERSESMFAAMASRHLQQALDLDALDLIGD